MFPYITRARIASLVAPNLTKLTHPPPLARARLRASVGANFANFRGSHA